MHMYDTPEFMAKVLDAYGVDYTQPKVMCPFHGDINPSMLIDLARSRVFCFGCQKSFNATQFVEAAEPELNKLMVYAKLAKIASGTSDIILKPEYLKANDSDKDQLLLQAKDYYYNLPKTDWEGEEWYDELIYLEQRGFSASTLNKCGAKLNYNGWYPIIFPMMDSGSFKGWVCRTTNKEIEKKRKYLYNTGFRRSTCLCGRYDNKSPLVVVEGYMDMLKLRQVGLKNVVAILGWKMSPEQRQKLKDKNITHIISALDNDKAGKDGDSYLRTLGFGEVDRWVFRKSQKDPGEQSPGDIKLVAKHFNLPIDNH